MPRVAQVEPDGRMVRAAGPPPADGRALRHFEVPAFCEELTPEEERRWLARKDSNLQSPDPESGALPIRPLASDARGAGRVYRETAPVLNRGARR